jgi:hypothetical protein
MFSNFQTVLVKKGVVMLVTTVLSISSSFAQSVNQKIGADTLQKIALSATIDTYFHRSFNSKQNAPRTSFANLPGFSLGMINVVGEYTGAKTGFVTDLVFGPRGTDAIFRAPLYKNAQGGGSSQLINQMYVYYNLTTHLRINAGQFNTFLGYEAISPAKNVNYSTSYLFSFGPFNHTGVWTDITFENGWSAKLAVMNPTDYTEYNPFDAYTLGGQLSVKGEKGNASINLTYGDPDGSLNITDSLGSISAGNALQIDFTGSINATSNYFIGVSASMRSIGSGHIKISDTQRTQLEKSGYCGVAVYQTLALAEHCQLALRTEYFSEFNGGIGAIQTYNNLGKASVIAMTLSGNIRTTNLCFIPELRFDKTSTNSFTRQDTGMATTHLTSLNLALVYTLPALVHHIPVIKK